MIAVARTVCRVFRNSGPSGPRGPSGWRTAMERALYGTSGFFVRERPDSHFRTSVHASPLFARAVLRLVTRVDAALGHPAEFTLLDVGAGRGELLRRVLDEAEASEAAEPDEATAPDGDGGRARLAPRLRVCAVERTPRPHDLDPRIAWTAELPPPGSVTGLVFANEWLDNVPVDVAETDDSGVVRYVLVDDAGEETLGDPVTGADADWLTRWWPLVAPAEPGLRAEIGHTREAAWYEAVRTLRRGAAVAVDYGHTLQDRPLFGTLTGYREGGEARPAPDGTCDLTAHVALDACADEGARAAPGGEAPSRRTQREVLHTLGVRGIRPPLALATSDPRTYVRALRDASEAAELTDPAGLGAFTWLAQPVGVPDPLHGDFGHGDTSTRADEVLRETGFDE